MTGYDIQNAQNPTLKLSLNPPFTTIPVIESEKSPIWFDDASHIFLKHSIEVGIVH